MATSGKDSLCILLQESLSTLGISSQRIALADELKRELDPFLREKFGISAFTRIPGEKEIIRPVLVAYGKVWRARSEGKYWTGLITPKVNSLIQSGVVPIVTDIRYDEYPEDEIYWVKKNGGKVVYVSRMENGSLIPPANEDEKRNDPRLISKSDYTFETVTVKNYAKTYQKLANQLAEKLIEI